MTIAFIENNIESPKIPGLYTVLYSDNSKGIEYFDGNTWLVNYSHPVAYWETMVFTTKNVQSLGEAILKHQFEIYNPLRQSVIKVSEIIYAFDKAGVDMLPKIDF